MDNTELARLIIKQVTEFPESFSMGTFGTVSDCGTIACLAGHAMLLSGYACKPGFLEVYYIRPDGTGVYCTGMPDEAQFLLGMSHEERYDTGEGDIFFDMVLGFARFAALIQGE